MKKLLYVLVFLGGFAVLYGVGRIWKLKPETNYAHMLHTGETGVVASTVGDTVWLARDQKNTYSVNVAMAQKDVASLQGSAASGAAFAVPVGTVVKVTDEAESRRRVEVTEGPLAGKQGWVEFEYVRPRQRGESR